MQNSGIHRDVDVIDLAYSDWIHVMSREQQLVHLSSELVTDPPTHSRQLKLCHHTTEFHVTW